MAVRRCASSSVLRVVVLFGCGLGRLAVLLVCCLSCRFFLFFVFFSLSLSLSLFLFFFSPSPCSLACLRRTPVSGCWEMRSGFLFFSYCLFFSLLLPPAPFSPSWGARPGRGFHSPCRFSSFPCKAASPSCLRLSLFSTLLPLLPLFAPPPRPPSLRPVSPPSLCLLFSFFVFFLSFLHLSQP